MKFTTDKTKIYCNGSSIYDIDSVKVSHLNKWSKTNYSRDNNSKINYLQISDNLRINIFKCDNYYCIFRKNKIKIRNENISNWIDVDFTHSQFFKSCVILLNEISNYYDYIFTDFNSDEFSENIYNISDIDSINIKKNSNVLFISKTENKLIKLVYNNKKILYNYILIKLFDY